MDDRQGPTVTRLLVALDQYAAHEVSLGALVNGLDALIDQLDLAKPQQVEDLRSEWWHLEAIYASILDEARTAPSSEENAKVEQAVERVRSLLKETDIGQEPHSPA